MGSGASQSQVRAISISQQEDTEPKRTRSRSRGSTGKRVLSAVTDTMRRANGSASSSSVRDRKQQMLRDAVDAAEKRANESEARVRALERELATKEQRSLELADEVTWLTQQLSDRPEVPVPARPPIVPSSAKRRSSHQSVDLAVVTVEPPNNRHTNDDVLRMNNDRLQSQVQQLERDLQRQAAQSNQTIHTLQEQLKIMTRKASSPNGSQAVGHATGLSELSDMNASMASTTSTNNRHSLILDMTSQLSELRANNKLLEEQLRERDQLVSQLQHKLEYPNVSANPHNNNNNNNNNNIGTTSTTNVNNNQNTNERKESANRQHRKSFAAVRRGSNIPVKVEKKMEETVEDEIEALMGLDKGEHNALLGTVPEYQDITSPKPTSDAITTLKNVFALTDTMEPIRMVETPQNSTRPQTAGVEDTSRSTSPTNQEILQQSFIEQGRQHTVPMFTKHNAGGTVTKQRVTHHRRRKPMTNPDDAEIMSLHGDLADEQTRTAPQATTTSASKASSRMSDRRHTSNSLIDNRFDSLTDDDENDVMAPLQESGRMSTMNSTRYRPGTSAGSTKSRDSGVVLHEHSLSRADTIQSHES